MHEDLCCQLHKLILYDLSCHNFTIILNTILWSLFVIKIRRFFPQRRGKYQSFRYMIYFILYQIWFILYLNNYFIIMVTVIILQISSCNWDINLPSLQKSLRHLWPAASPFLAITYGSQPVVLVSGSLVLLYSMTSLLGAGWPRPCVVMGTSSHASVQASGYSNKTILPSIIALW